MTDPITARFYATHAATQVQAWESFGETDVVALLRERLRPRSEVLDVGAGSGRDASALLALGHKVHAVEPSDALRRAALELHPELAGALASDSLPHLGTIPNRSYDAVICSAVLMHLPRSDYSTALRNIRRVLKPGGELTLAVPVRRDDLDTQSRDAAGRLHTVVPVEDVVRLARVNGLLLVYSKTNVDPQRPGIEWWTGVLRRAQP